MSFLGSLFGNRKKFESAVLIDAGADSIAGAYVQYVEGEMPAVLYTQRLPVEIREGEARERAMLRALQILGDTLIREGAPILARTTGKGSADIILVSINAPWQKTLVRTEHLEQETPFVFTKSLVAKALEETSLKAFGKMLVDESVIGTILNGYETRDPYEKKVRRAAIIVLSSLIDEPVAKDVISVLQGVYHTRHILPIAGSSLRYQAVRKAFPHESDLLILDATGPVTSIALVRKGLFVAIAEVPGDNAADTWMERVETELAELAKQYPLPRTIFLLARESDISSLRQMLDTIHLGKLWLSDNPPKIVSVLASHVVGLVRQATATSPDLSLLLMALYLEHRISDVER